MILAEVTLLFLRIGGFRIIFFGKDHDFSSRYLNLKLFPPRFPRVQIIL